jgi:hypothetical protein
METFHFYLCNCVVTHSLGFCRLATRKQVSKLSSLFIILLRECVLGCVFLHRTELGQMCSGCSCFLEAVKQLVLGIMVSGAFQYGNITCTGRNAYVPCWECRC